MAKLLGEIEDNIDNLDEQNSQSLADEFDDNEQNENQPPRMDACTQSDQVVVDEKDQKQRHL